MAEINLTVRIELDEDGKYVAHCVELGTSSFGDTSDEAMKNIGEAIEAHLSALLSLDRLESALEQAGVPIVEPVLEERALTASHFSIQNVIRKMESSVRVAVPA